MAARRRTTRKSTSRRSGGYSRGYGARRSSRRTAAPRRRASARSGRAGTQRIVIEFAGAAPVRDGMEGLGLTKKPAPPARNKPRL